MTATPIIYLFDPLCGWCYGATDRIARLAAHPAVALTLLPSGLFCGWDAIPMDAAMADHARTSDAHVARLTGRTFSDDYRRRILDDRSARMNSLPATWALTAVALTQPEAQLDTLTAIQTARFVAARDITSADVLYQILTEQQLAPAARLFQAAALPLRQSACSSILSAEVLMRRLGASGVPALAIGQHHDQWLIPADRIFEDPSLFDLPPAIPH